MRSLPRQCLLVAAIASSSAFSIPSIPTRACARCPAVRCGDGASPSPPSPPASVAPAARSLPDYAVKAPRRIRKGEGSAPRNGKAGKTGQRGAERATVRAQGKASQVRELQRLYITGGTARGRRIVTPDVYLRPMMSRVREALFSLLYMTGVLRPSASHLDLFSGAGTVGLEALSRGVGAATFVDFSPICAKAIRENAESLGVADRATVLEARVDAVLQTPEAFGLTRPFELVTLTPPYEEVRALRAARRMRPKAAA